MKRIVVIALCLGWTVHSFSQFGINAGYRLNHAPDWQWAASDAGTPDPVLGNGFSVGVDYWMRLKNYRLEFLPELNYSRFNKTLPLDRETSNQFFSFFLNTNWYLFDFEGDCNCPTFSKQGQFLKKGFFVQLSPGITYLKNSFTMPQDLLPDNKETIDSNSWAFSIGLGAGIDIGVSDLFTVTPMVGLRYFPSANWPQLSDLAPDKDGDLQEKSAILQAYGGIRLGWRLDYSSRRRY